MELVNEFTVNTSIDEAWATLTDVERIAPCLPGAQLQEVEGDTYRGVVKVKVGPILAQFKGEASWVERDDADHRAVLRAKGRDTGGKGNAEALITARAEPAGDGATKVSVHTDLTITGKVAQFGRGALADVSTKLLGQFVDNLHEKVLQPQAEAAAVPADPAGMAEATAHSAQVLTGAEEVATTAPAAAAADPPASTGTASSGTASSGTPSSGPRRIEGPEAQPIDLLETAGAPLAKRLAPVAVLVVLLLLVLRRRRRT
jgi:carbon monoxide dehydrogenase subunit G